jgi:hypothetical protein
LNISEAENHQSYFRQRITIKELLVPIISKTGRKLVGLEELVVIKMVNLICMIFLGNQVF